MVSGHDDRLAGTQSIWMTIDTDFGFPVDNLHQSIEWGGVFTEFLTSIEGKQRDIATRDLENHGADNRLRLIVQHLLEIKNRIG